MTATCSAASSLTDPFLLRWDERESSSSNRQERPPSPGQGLLVSFSIGEERGLVACRFLFFLGSVIDAELTRLWLVDSHSPLAVINFCAEVLKRGFGHFEFVSSVKAVWR